MITSSTIPRASKTRRPDRSLPYRTPRPPWLRFRYGVHVYINGHEHNLQHIVQDNVHYITCGSGSQTFPMQAAPGQFASGRHGFMAMRLEKDTLGFSFIDDRGNTLHRANIARQA